MKACSIFVMNPVPMSAPVRSSHRVLPYSRARMVVYIAAVMRRASRASGSSTWFAWSHAALNPPPPSRDCTCATRMAQEFTPKIRADSSITHNEAGGLSTVMKFDASEEPKNAAFRLLVPAWTAAE